MIKLLFSTLITILCALIWQLPFHYLFIIGLESYLFILFLIRFGEKFIFLELLGLVSCTQWLFAPMLADLLGVGMSIEYIEYFNYALPASALYLFGLFYPLWNSKKLDNKVSNIINSLKVKLKNQEKWGLILISIGLPAWLLQFYVPIAISYVFYLMANLFMVGLCFLFFTNSSLKWILILISYILLVFTTLLNGMIGTIIFWSFIFIVLLTTIYQVRIHLAWKFLVVTLGLWIILILQISKTEYRIETWDISSSGNSPRTNREISQNPSLFFQLILSRIINPRSLTDERALIAIAARLNQGYLVALTMDYVPKHQPFGSGEVTIGNTAQALIPRLFWRDKPIVGQAEYFKKYTGVSLSKFNSATLGPLGDVYADFGKSGILALGLFGAFIGFIYSSWVKLSFNNSSLFIWFIVVYFGSVVVSEISVAGYINSIVKYVLFIFVIRVFINSILKTSI